MNNTNFLKSSSSSNTSSITHGRVGASMDARKGTRGSDGIYILKARLLSPHKPTTELSLAPKNHQVPDGSGRVLYRHDEELFRHDEELFRKNKEMNCLLEAVAFALGDSRACTRKMLGVPLGTNCSIIDVCVYASEMGKQFPFAFYTPKQRRSTWSTLIVKTKGIFIGRCTTVNGDARGKHYIVYDAWRNVLYLGGGKGDGNVVFIEDKDRENPKLFEDNLIADFHFLRGLEFVYTVYVTAKRCFMTKYNTPEHYPKKKRKKRKRKKTSSDVQSVAKRQRLSECPTITQEVQD